MSERCGPILKWPGSKWRMARGIAATLPAHRAYLEPFAGSLALLFAKPRSFVETVGDVNGDVVNLFRVVRERPADLAAAAALTPYARAECDLAWAEERVGEPVEDARRFLVRCWMNHGQKQVRKGGWAHTTGASRNGRASGVPNRAGQWAQLPDRIWAVVGRLQGVQIESRPALDLIARHAHADCLIYADPPYPRATRTEGLYRDEMTDADHGALLDALDAHPGPVILSGYACPLYDGRLVHWHRTEIAANAEKGLPRTEVIWRNARAATTLLDLAGV